MTAPLTDEELLAIEQRAAAATSQDWIANGHLVACADPLGDDVCDCSLDGVESDQADGARDAAHIAGMDPSTTLRLVAELRAARAEVDAQDRNVVQLLADVRTARADLTALVEAVLGECAEIAYGPVSTAANHDTSKRLRAIADRYDRSKP